MGMPTLINEFPVLRCKTEKSDSIDLQNNHLGWVRGACANMTLRFIEMPDWVETRIGFSRYTFIPVCNLTETDMHQNMIDILYARQLNQSKHLIWYSDTSMPDLGGHEDRSCRIYFQDDIESPEWE
jgi:DNA polymerase epsilon subunit 1